MKPLQNTIVAFTLIISFSSKSQNLDVQFDFVNLLPKQYFLKPIFLLMENQLNLLLTIMANTNLPLKLALSLKTKMVIYLSLISIIY